MKAFLLSLFAICVLSLACIYLFLPAKINFSKVIIIKAKINIANRFLMDESKWPKWFPADSVGNSSNKENKNTFLYKNYFFSLEKKMMNAAEVSISYDQTVLKSLVTMISINNDSVAVEWKSTMPETVNPVSRVTGYLKAREIQGNMNDILKRLQIFLAKNENIYGVYIHEIISKDSTLIAARVITTGYPTTPDIYNLITNLRTYIQAEGAKENNFPMLHVKQINDTTFESMVAIPVNKYLGGNGTLFSKRFVPWKVLTAAVKGGTYTVNEALRQMEIYISDNHREAMAIPFESLVTDRSKQPDTLQWVTGIYTPVR